MSYVPPERQGIFQLKRNGANWDVVDTRTGAVVLAGVALAAAQADAIARNLTLNTLGA